MAHRPAPPPAVHGPAPGTGGSRKRAVFPLHIRGLPRWCSYPVWRPDFVEGKSRTSSGMCRSSPASRPDFNGRHRRHSPPPAGLRRCPQPSRRSDPRARHFFRDTGGVMPWSRSQRAAKLMHKAARRQPRGCAGCCIKQRRGSPRAGELLQKAAPRRPGCSRVDAKSGEGRGPGAGGLMQKAARRRDCRASPRHCAWRAGANG